MQNFRPASLSVPQFPQTTSASIGPGRMQPTALRSGDDDLGAGRRRPFVLAVGSVRFAGPFGGLRGAQAADLLLSGGGHAGLHAAVLFAARSPPGLTGIGPTSRASPTRRQQLAFDQSSPRVRPGRRGPRRRRGVWRLGSGRSNGSASRTSSVLVPDRRGRQVEQAWSASRPRRPSPTRSPRCTHDGRGGGSADATSRSSLDEGSRTWVLGDGRGFAEGANVPTSPRRGRRSGARTACASSDVAASDVRVEADAVVVPGGWAPDKLRRHAEVLAVVRGAHDAGKIVGLMPRVVISPASWRAPAPPAASASGRPRERGRDLVDDRRSGRQPVWAAWWRTSPTSAVGWSPRRGAASRRRRRTRRTVAGDLDVPAPSAGSRPR
jgi:hypothetical protein